LHMPYLSKKVSQNQRDELLAFRKVMRRPWHRPPHFGEGGRYYLLTAACYEHKPWIGVSPERMSDFSQSLLKEFQDPPTAWCVLPNHYHVLVHIEDLKSQLKTLGRLHGRTSRFWNLQDHAPKRKVWYSISDRAIRNGGHLWATVNYIHHNPVKHGYAEKWDEWPFSSAAGFLESEGRECALRIWTDYPIHDYGKGWDEMKEP